MSVTKYCIRCNNPKGVVDGKQIPITTYHMFMLKTSILPIYTVTYGLITKQKLNMCIIMHQNFVGDKCTWTRQRRGTTIIMSSKKNIELNNYLHMEIIGDP